MVARSGIATADGALGYCRRGNSERSAREIVRAAGRNAAKVRPVRATGRNTASGDMRSRSSTASRGFSRCGTQHREWGFVRAAHAAPRVGICPRSGYSSATHAPGRERSDRSPAGATVRTTTDPGRPALDPEFNLEHPKTPGARAWTTTTERLRPSAKDPTPRPRHPRPSDQDPAPTTGRPRVVSAKSGATRNAPRGRGRRGIPRSGQAGATARERRMVSTYSTREISTFLVDSRLRASQLTTGISLEMASASRTS